MGCSHYVIAQMLHGSLGGKGRAAQSSRPLDNAGSHANLHQDLACEVETPGNSIAKHAGSMAQDVEGQGYASNGSHGWFSFLRALP